MDSYQSSYTIKVPQGISAGQTFPVVIAGKTMLITCPQGSGGGSMLHAKVITSVPQRQVVTVSRFQPGGSSRAAINSCIIYWATLELILFILLTLSYSLVPYATQRISTECNVVNTRTVSKVSAMYYFLYDGISSSTVSCKSSSQNFWYMND